MLFDIDYCIKIFNLTTTATTTKLATATETTAREAKVTVIVEITTTFNSTYYNMHGSLFGGNPKEKFSLEKRKIVFIAVVFNLLSSRHPYGIFKKSVSSIHG